jgi:hypothetical protein
VCFRWHIGAGDAAAGVGALIVSRYPRNVIGWLFPVGSCGDIRVVRASQLRNPRVDLSHFAGSNLPYLFSPLTVGVAIFRYACMTSR